ncbi:MAG: hypothetical protein PQJ50_10015 [Spirochaetales bacterium]|nr:hypothetical protein [Spirochaetales bacterium]
MKAFRYIIIPLFLISQLLYSQSFAGEGESIPDAEESASEVSVQPDKSGGDALEAADTAETADAPDTRELPMGYGRIMLGMELDQVKELLLTESRFDFRGDPDVSIQRGGNQSLISSRGRSFIDQGFFQFNDSALYLIILNMNPEKIDFFSMQQSLTGRYGDPDELSPEGLYWRNEKVQMSLEYPLTVKYLDLEVFDSFIQEDIRLKSFQEISRTKFLEEF